MNCPEYRIRLFLSVDLVGSTAFKNKFDKPNIDADSSSPNPVWVDRIRHFYKDFPERVVRSYEKLDKPEELSIIKGYPKVWKTIGDEIVFCCKLSSLEHMSLCVRSFVDALEQYGNYLDSIGRVLDVKGYGWVAAFPSSNVTVSIFSVQNSTDNTNTASQEFPDESLEKEADANPAAFDFLGKEIDSGFRSGKHCSADKLSMSLELAWLLTDLNGQGYVKGLEYAYQGRHALKGVLNDRPYPVFSIDVERSQSRKNVRQRERVVNGEANAPKAMHIHDFLDSFFLDENIERPILRKLEKDSDELTLPDSYKSYRENWIAIAEEISQRSKNESEAASADDKSLEEVDKIIMEATEILVARSKAAK